MVYITNIQMQLQNQFLTGLQPDGLISSLGKNITNVIKRYLALNTHSSLYWKP